MRKQQKARTTIDTKFMRKKLQVVNCTHCSYYGSRVVDPRLTGSGLRLTGSGLRLTGFGLRLTGSGLRSTGSGLRLTRFEFAIDRIRVVICRIRIRTRPPRKKPGPDPILKKKLNLDPTFKIKTDPGSDLQKT